MSKLIFIPVPLPEESPTSVLKRMAERHGCLTRSELCHLGGSASHEGALIYTENDTIQRIANLIPEFGDRENFLSCFYTARANFGGPPTKKVLGIELESFMLRIKGPQYCSACWQEGCERFFKDLKLAVYCPYHARKYLSHCRICGHPLASLNLLSGSCHCVQLPDSEHCEAKKIAIERRLLALFRSKNSDDLEKFQKYLWLLGYRSKDSSTCFATRAVVSMALALIDGDEERILLQLTVLKQLYPGIPKRIICAKLAAIPTPEAYRCIRQFLRTDHVTSVDYEKDGGTHLSTIFSLSRAQIEAWQSIRVIEVRMLRRHKGLAPRNGCYNWQVAAKIAAVLLDIRLKHLLGRQSHTVDHSIEQVQHILVLSVAAIRGAVLDGLLSPVIRHCGQWYFRPTDIEQFSEKYTSIQLLSIQSGHSIKKIRKTLKRFGISDNELADPVAKLRIISVRLKDAVLGWLNRTVKIIHLKTQHHHRLPHLTGNEPGVWYSSSEAAVQLNVHRCVVNELIGRGLLSCDFRLQKGNSYALSQASIDDFKRDYISVGEARPLLQCNYTSTSRMLAALNIFPVGASGTDSKYSTYFLRSEVAQIAYSIMSSLTDNDRYSIGEAYRILKISRSSIRILIDQGILHRADVVNIRYNFITKHSVDNFLKNYATADTIAKWLSLPKVCLRQQLKKMAILPVIGGLKHDHKLDIFRRDDVSRIFPEFQHADWESPAKQSYLIAISTLTTEYGISTKSFTSLFVLSGFISPWGSPRNKKNLTRTDATKVSKILDEFLTYPQADVYLGHKSRCHHLVLKNRLTSVCPMRPFSKIRMVKRSDVAQYLLGKD
jgi:hypothetical protein